MIALLCSVHAEAEHILAWTTVKATTQFGSKSIIAGTLAGREVLVCVGGMGKVNAAHAATILIADFAPEALVVFGVGGDPVELGLVASLNRPGGNVTGLPGYNAAQVILGDLGVKLDFFPG